MSHPPGTPDPQRPPEPWYPGPTGHPGYAPYSYQRPTNGKATAALWTGVASIVMTPICCGLGVLGVVPLVLGVQARNEIHRGGGQQGGDGMALTGIILGAVAVLLSLVIIGFIVFVIATGATSFHTSGGTSL
jgi:hypothetical protein